MVRITWKRERIDVQFGYMIIEDCNWMDGCSQRLNKTMGRKYKQSTYNTAWQTLDLNNGRIQLHFTTPGHIFTFRTEFIFNLQHINGLAMKLKFTAVMM